MKGKPPVEVELVIGALDDGGMGRSQINERPAAVRNALPGERVTARILRKRRGMRYAEATTVAPASANPERVRPYCRAFPRCGGCALHHLRSEAQLLHKQSMLAAALEDVGVVPAGWSEPVCAQRLGYRRKARLGVRKVGDQVLVGFRESFSNRVARLQDCPILSADLGRLIGPLRELVGQLSIAALIPQIEVAQGEGSCVLMLRHLAPLSAADLQLCDRFENRHGVILLLQSGGYDSLRDLSGQRPAPLTYTLTDSGLCMQFLPHQFTQVNLAMNGVLIRHMLAYLGGHKRRLHGAKVADLFCGIGNLSLPLARAGASVWGYESGQEAVQMAWRNAELNHLQERTHFAALDLYHDASMLPEDLDMLVLDPPRSGAGPNLGRWLTRFGGRECVYISCNPFTFASDAAVFGSAGFELHRVGVFDMFPHTAHVETIGYFRRG